MKSFLGDTLAIAFDSLTLAIDILECAEIDAEEFSPEAKQRFSLVHAGLAMATQGMECEELLQLIKQSKAQCESLSN